MSSHRETLVKGSTNTLETGEDLSFMMKRIKQNSISVHRLQFNVFSASL